MILPSNSASSPPTSPLTAFANLLNRCSHRSRGMYVHVPITNLGFSHDSNFVLSRRSFPRLVVGAYTRSSDGEQ